MQELVESEREYQLCDRGATGGRVVFVSSFLSPFMLQFCLSTFIFSAHLPGTVCVCVCVCVCVTAPLASPSLTVPERCRGFSLVCLSVYGLQRSVCVRVCVFGCINTHRPSNTAMLLLV